MDSSFAEYPQLWFVCKFCKRAFSEIQKLKAHKRHEHYAQLKEGRRKKRREENIAKQESLSETLTEIIPGNSESIKGEIQQELPVPVPAAVSPEPKATVSSYGGILKNKKKGKDPSLAFVDVKRLSPKAIETALSSKKNNTPRYGTPSEALSGNVQRNSEPEPETETGKDENSELTISPRPLVPVTLDTSITPKNKEPSLGRVADWLLSPTTTTTTFRVGADILKENRNRMLNFKLNQANCPLQEISSQINLKMDSRPTNKSSKTPSSRFHGSARHTNKQFSPSSIPLIPARAVSSLPAASVIKRVPQIIPTSTSNCNKNYSANSIPSTGEELEFTNASSQLQSITTVPVAVPKPAPAPASAVPPNAAESKISDTCNADDNYEEDLSKKLELLEALGLMPKSLFDAQRPGRYYIRKRNSVINYSESAQAHQRCRKCCVTFDLLEQLEAHEKVCQKYKCKHCKKFYTDVESLNDHEWALHEQHPQGSLRTQLEVQAQKQKQKSKRNFPQEINQIMVSKSPHKIKKPFKNKNSKIKKKTSPKEPTGNIPVPGKDPKERLIMLIKASADSITVLSSIACENTKVVNISSSTDENQQAVKRNDITKRGRGAADIVDLDLDLDLGSDSDPEPDPNLSSDSSRDQTSPARDLGRLFCDVCQPIKYFNQPYQLKLHNFLKHSAHNKFKCHVCSKSYRSQYDLNYHIIWHKKEIRDVEGFVPLRSSTHTQQHC